jgi:tetrapyrrole methylase family protein / MazG family protein
MKNGITVVGLGFGDEQALTVGTIQCLERSEQVWLRTEKHPVVEWMREKALSFQTFDAVYEAHSDFPSVYREIADQLFALAQQGSSVVYAVPGHPLVAEKSVQILLQEGPQRGVAIEVHGGGSFLDVAFARLQIDPIEGFQLVDGQDINPDQIHPRNHLLIGQVYDRLLAAEVKLTLMEVYPDEHVITLATALGVKGREQMEQIPLYQLDHGHDFTDLTSIYVPPIQAEESLYRRFDYLKGVIAKLRSPAGCPWDREQTHESLRPYLIEEAYEFLEAVANQDGEAMADELGDVLLQVLLHAQIASEEDVFAISEVIEKLTEKMIRRHPHIFGEGKADTAEEVKQNWEEIKRQERKEQGPTSILAGLPVGLPALLQAYEQQKKAAKVGFDWERKEDVLKKVEEELQELFAAKTSKEQAEELGDLLFAVISLARFFQVHPELALLGACQKFARRFHCIEQKASEHGKPLQEFTLAEMDAWWEEAKKREGGVVE